MKGAALTRLMTSTALNLLSRRKLLSPLLMTMTRDQTQTKAMLTTATLLSPLASAFATTSSAHTLTK